MKKIISFISVMFLTLMMGNAFANIQTAVSDTTITTEIKTELFEKKMFDNNTNLDPLVVHVTTANDGQVTLTGHVKNEHEKMRATEIAKSVNGVKSVDNQLVIKP
jgi:hyperosmotically inducible periplasmic protein